MGFDIFIGLRLQIDEETGLSAIWGEDSDGKTELIPFNRTDYVVPEQFRRFITMGGHMFHAYIDLIGGGGGERFECDCSELLESYPLWEEVAEDVWYQDKGYEEIWKEADHDAFHAALKWFSSKSGFYLRWSY